MGFNGFETDLTGFYMGFNGFETDFTDPRAASGGVCDFTGF